MEMKIMIGGKKKCIYPDHQLTCIKFGVFFVFFLKIKCPEALTESCCCASWPALWKSNMTQIGSVCFLALMEKQHGNKEQTLKKSADKKAGSFCQLYSGVPVEQWAIKSLTGRLLHEQLELLPSSVQTQFGLIECKPAGQQKAPRIRGIILYSLKSRECSVHAVCCLCL